MSEINYNTFFTELKSWPSLKFLFFFCTWPTFCFECATEDRATEVTMNLLCIPFTWWKTWTKIRKQNVKFTFPTYILINSY